MKNILCLNHLAQLVLSIGVVTVVASCDLTRMPTQSLPTDESLETFDDATAYNRGIMAQFRNRQGGVFATTQEYQADCLNAMVDFGNRNGDIHGWVDLSPSTSNFATVYSMYYSTLKNVNFTLDNYGRVRESLKPSIDAAQKNYDDAVKEFGGSEDDLLSTDYGKSLYNALRNEKIKSLQISVYEGNAYFARAFYYFNLCQRFGTPYSKATAGTDLGVPLVLTFDVSERQTRATNEQCYAQIFKDLAEAEKTLAARKVQPGNSEFTVDAVNALRARIYLEMKDYENAYKYSSALINSNTYPLVAPTADNFVNMWKYDESTEDILRLFIMNGDEEPNGMGAYYSVSRDDQVVNADFIPTQGLIDMYSDKDLRKDVYFELSSRTKANAILYTNKLYLVSKYKGNPKYADIKNDPKYPEGVPNGRHEPRVFRIAEQYLIAAEAAYKTGKDALKPLNALRVSRGLDPINASGDELFQAIKDERLRELAFEGFRLWDLRRWNDPVVRMTPQLPQGVTNDQGDPINPNAHLAKGFADLSVSPSDPMYKRTV